MKKNIFTLLSITLLTGMFLISSAQNIDFKSSNFKNRKDEFKAAMQSLESGNKLFEAGEAALEQKKDPKTNFIQALAFFEKANSFNPDNADLNFKIGKCLLYGSKKSEAFTFFEIATRLAPDDNPEYYFYMGQAYMLSDQFNKAKEQYVIYKNKLKEKDFEKVKDIYNKALAECENAVKSYVDPAKVWIDNMAEINTEYPEFGAVIGADDDMVIFNSKRPGSIGGKILEDGYYDSDIYVTYRKNGAWTKPELLKGPFNTPGEDECLALSPDGQKMLLLKDNGGNTDIYISELKGDSWSSPSKLGDGRISTQFNETAACFSPEGIKIYFVSDQTYNNRGGKDIFFSGKMHPLKDLWGTMQTIGSEVNTKEDECFVFMHPDGETMFISSKGHESMGGYDIFMSKRLSGIWSKPVNMGYPINTPYDETSFVMTADGRHGYVASNRVKGGKGDFDIYRITFIGAPKPQIVITEDQLLANFAKPVRDMKIESAVDVESKNLTVFKGVVLDAFTKNPIEADIEITDNSKGELISAFKANSKTGRFLLALPSGTNYGIAVKAPDYMFYSDNIDFPKTAEFQLIEKEIWLTNVCIGCKIILRNIFFDFGKATLRPESATELTRLIDLINAIAKIKPNVKVEISGHTDNIGGDASNLLLSENRAKAVVTYLTQKGINPARLAFKGYGSTQPVSDNKTDAGRQLNRRTEFKIIE